MNRENIQKVRDYIAELEPSQFRMDQWADQLDANGESMLIDFAQRDSLLRHDCGTCACIGGWTMALLGEGKITMSSEAAGALLGLGKNEATCLFYPAYIANREWGKITPEQGVRVLDHLLETGKVDWSVAVSERS